jgi:hypothetical protein
MVNIIIDWQEKFTLQVAESSKFERFRGLHFQTAFGFLRILEVG